MKININSVHFKADSKLEDFITLKLEKVCAKNSDVIGSEVTLKLDNTDTPENKIVDIIVDNAEGSIASITASAKEEIKLKTELAK